MGNPRTMKPPKDLTYSIAKLELEPGDLLVVRFKEPPNAEANDMLNRLVRPMGAKVLFVPPDLDLTVLTKADIDARVTPQAPVQAAWPATWWHRLCHWSPPQ